MLLYPCWPEYLHYLPDPKCTLTPLHPWQPQHPYISSQPPTPLHPLRAPDFTDTHAGTWVPTLPVSPQCIPDTPTSPRSPLMPPITLLACEYLQSLPAPQWTPDTPDGPPDPLGASQCPLMLLIPLLAPQYLHPLPAPQCTPDTSTLSDGSSIPPDTPYIPKSPSMPLMLAIPLLAPQIIHCLPAPQCTPCQPLEAPWHPYTTASEGI